MKLQMQKHASLLREVITPKQRKAVDAFVQAPEDYSTCTSSTSERLVGALCEHERRHCALLKRVNDTGWTMERMCQRCCQPFQPHHHHLSHYDCNGCVSVVANRCSHLAGSCRDVVGTASCTCANASLSSNWTLDPPSAFSRELSHSLFAPPPGRSSDGVDHLVSAMPRWLEL